MRTSATILGAAIFLLSVATTLVWYAAIREDHRGILTVSFLNAGQGDAIFIETPSGRSVLIDGGPDDSVLRELGTVMPFYTHSLDVVIATAPTPEKISGLTSVLSRYTISVIVRSAAHSNAPQTQAFTGAVAQAEANGTRLLVLRRGQVFDLGASIGSGQAPHAYLEILFPDRDASNFSPGDGCLVMKLLFGDTSFLFACGSQALEEYVATLDGSKLHADVLSATGNEPEVFAGFVSSQFAVLPCGSNATSSAFATLQIPTLDTCDGTLTFVSDGQTVTRQ